MRSLHFGLGLLLIAGLGVTAACGGSDTTTPTPGAAGAGGTGTAGAAGSGVAGLGTAGAGTAGAGTAGAGTAGAGTAGAGTAGAGTAGAAGGGTAGAAGAGGNPTFCPGTAPTAGGMCTPPMGGGFNNTCHYSTEACQCPGNGMAANTWVCLDCPATEPAAMSMCTAPMNGGFGLNCTYANGDNCTCNAFGGMNATWNCTMPPPPMLMCPMTAPMTGDSCTAVGSCTFNGGTMNAQRCVCTGTTFTCGMAGDPAATCTAAMGAQLMTGDMCTNVGRCQGGNTGGRTCVCDGKTVTCN